MRLSSRRPVRAAMLIVCCILAICVASAALPTGAQASTGTNLYNQAQARYSATDYTGAARLYEQALQAGYTKPAVYYKLGLSFAHLKMWDGVVWAMQTLQQQSPSYASSHSLVGSRLTAAQAQGGKNRGMPPLSSIGTVASSGGSSSGPGPGSDTDRQVSAALSSSDVYVASGMKNAVSSADVSTLASDASALASKGTPAKYAILSGVPSPYATLGQFTEALYASLKMKHAVLVAVTPGGVSAWTDRLSPSDLSSLVSASRPQFLNGTYATGAMALAHAIVNKANAADTAASTGRIVFIVIVLAVIAVVLALFIRSRWSRWQKSYAEAMGWRDGVAELENTLSTDVQYLQPNDPRQIAFAAGAEYYGKAAAALDQLGGQSPFSVAFGGGPLFRRLGEARLNLQESEGKLREAGATGPQIVGAAPAAAQPGTPAQQGGTAPRAYRDANQIAPTPAQAACFFCGKPLDPATAEAVVVPVGQQQRRVLVCQEHGTAVQRGQQPEVRTFTSPSLGRQVPWWAAPEYIPYRDYDPYYYRRGNGLGWGDLLLYETLFNRPTTNVIYVDDDRWQGGWDGGNVSGNFNPSYSDAGSFASGSPDLPSAPEASFGNDGGSYGGGDRS